jgi:hypothetical protein
MDIRTHAIFISADPDATFAYVSDIDNLPRWAINFCHSVERDRGFNMIETPAGRMLFQLKADGGTGIIDFIGGPSSAQLTRWHSRVVAAPGGGSLFIFTAVRQPGEKLEAFEGQCTMLAEELECLRRQVEGASATDASSDVAEAGPVAPLADS